MATVIVLMGMIAGAVELELTGCEDLVDSAALTRQLNLEGAESVDAVAHLECHDDGWVLELLTAQQRHRSEPLLLPDLRADSQLRVLALIIVERARSLSLALPTRLDANVGPHVGRALWTLGQGQQPLWRLTVSATTEAGWTVGPLRGGAQIGVQRGPWGLTGGFSFGTLSHSLGRISALSVTVEPEVTVLCGQVSAVQGCVGARFVVGYGSLSGSEPSVNVTAARAEGPIFGGAGRLSLTLNLNAWLALDVNGTLGWLRAPVGTIDGVRSAALGGGYFQARAGLAFLWGTP